MFLLGFGALATDVIPDLTTVRSKVSFPSFASPDNFFGSFSKKMDTRRQVREVREVIFWGLFLISENAEK